MSSFSGNWVVTSSWKLRTLFRKATCFPGKAQEEHKEQGRRRDKKPCLLLASTEFLLLFLGVRNRERLRKMRKQYETESRSRDQNSHVAQSSGWSSFSWRASPLDSSWRVLNGNVSILYLPKTTPQCKHCNLISGCQTDHDHFVALSIFIQHSQFSIFSRLSTIAHLNIFKKIHNKKNWPRSFHELCYFFKVTKTNIHIPSLITVN